MKIIKIILGSVAALWFLGIFLKLMRNLPYLFQGDLGVSRLLGSIAGLIISGLLCYICFKGAFQKDLKTPNQP